MYMEGELMKVTIINCFDTYGDRVDLIHRYFQEKDYDVDVLQSNFKHIKKEYITEKKEGYTYIETKPYSKNFSVNRMISHMDFSKKAAKYLHMLKPDILYVLLPPNSLAKTISNYKRENPEVKLVFDILDLWPETFPINTGMNAIPFIYWRNLRNYGIDNANLIITECNYYQLLLKETLINKPKETLYLAQKKIHLDIKEPDSRIKTINLAYLGSINNIIDIEKIVEIIKEIQVFKSVHLHIIGDGEKKEQLINSVRKAGAHVTYYGKVYDLVKKQEIFNKCHFGLNIMKKSVKVGLTMKSIDYLQHGLPLINNIPFDTKFIVENNKIGINIFSSKDYNEFFKKGILFPDTFERKNVLKVFDQLFTDEVFSENLNTILAENNIIN